MKAYFQSLRCALCGLTQAIRTERNLKLFILGVLLTLIFVPILGLPVWKFMILLLSGGTFLSVELMNTALEHFTDAFDTHTKKQDDIHFDAIKATKDIAAAAALVSAGTWALVTFLIYLPHVLLLLRK